MRPEVVRYGHVFAYPFSRQFEGQIQLFKEKHLLQYSVNSLVHHIIGFGHAGFDTVCAQMPLKLMLLSSYSPTTDILKDNEKSFCVRLTYSLSPISICSYFLL